MRWCSCGSRPDEVAAAAARRRPEARLEAEHPRNRTPVVSFSAEIRVVPLLVPVGRLARLQPLEAAGHDLREAPGAGGAAVEATDQLPVHDHLVVLAETL